MTYCPWQLMVSLVGISQDFKRKTVFNQRRGAAWGPQGFLWRVKIIFKFELLRKTWGKKIKFQTIDLSPGILSSKPSKLNKDFAEPRWWRTSSAPLVPPLLLLSTGSLGCTTSCFLAERGKCKGNIVCYWGNSLERVFTTFNYSAMITNHCCRQM